MVQLELFGGAMSNSEDKKPRLTLKAKRGAVSDMMDQVKQGWEPSDDTWRLIDWLNHDIREAQAKKQ